MDTTTIMVTTTPTSLGTSLYSVTVNATSSSLYNGPETVQNLWNVGDGIRFEQWDSETPVTGSGQIKAITGTGNNITFKVYMPIAPSGFTTSGRTWHFMIPHANNQYITNNQKTYAFIDSGYLSGNVNFPNTLQRKISY